MGFASKLVEPSSEVPVLKSESRDSVFFKASFSVVRRVR
jgi:hypothetical protein